MPLLFSYGTLQDEQVQLATFGRAPQGQRDSLPGFERRVVAITDPVVLAGAGSDHHANACFTGIPEDRVEGTVLDISDAELEAADRYERHSAYRRVPVTLTSGTRAWVYVHSAGTRDRS